MLHKYVPFWWQQSERGPRDEIAEVFGVWAEETRLQKVLQKGGSRFKNRTVDMALCIFHSLADNLVPGNCSSAQGIHAQGTHNDAQGMHKGAHNVELYLVHSTVHAQCITALCTVTGVHRVRIVCAQGRNGQW